MYISYLLRIEPAELQSSKPHQKPSLNGRSTAWSIAIESIMRHRRTKSLP